MAPRLLIGLTGNIATGKSTVAQALRDLGAHVIDADQITRLVESKGQPALDQIVAAFGSEMLQTDGELNRSALGRIVFNDAAKLKQLEAIVHPAVRIELARQLAEMPPDSVAVIEVIKLFESGWAEQCDQIWVTHCPPEEQVSRLMHSRGMSATDARARVAAQNPQDEKRARADVVIDTSGTHEETRAQAALEWKRRVADQAPVSTTDGSLTHGPKLELIDWSIRLLACALAVIALTILLIAQTPNKEGTLSLVILAALFGMYLLDSIEPVVRRLYNLAQSTPIAIAILPLFLLIPYAVLGRRTAQVDISDMLTAGMLLFLPTALALVNSPHARWTDVTLGLVAVAMPLVAPLLRSETLTGADTVLRIGAFVLPIVLLALSTPQQKERLNFLFLCAVLALWYSIEFSAFPVFSLPGLSLLGQSTDMSFFHLAVICTLLYVLAIAGRFGELGLSFKPSAHGLSVVATNLAIFTLIAIPIGLVSGFIKPGLTTASLSESLLRAFTIYITIALPEELLFRGTLLTYLNDTLRLPQAQAIILSALLFGAYHLNNPPNAVWYFVLATIAGVFYARTYLATKNVAAAATLHAAVDWLWMLVFAG